MLTFQARLAATMLAVLVSAAPATRAQQVAPQGADVQTDEPVSVEDPPGESRIRGKIVDVDGAPVANARILAYNLSTETIHRSEPTDKRGKFFIGDLPHGYYDVAIETADGLFVVNTVVSAEPGAKAVVELTLVPYAQVPAELPRAFAGAQLPSTGVAQVKRKPTGKEYWKSPKGIAIIGGSGAALLLLLALSGDDSTEPPASQFTTP